MSIVISSVVGFLSGLTASMGLGGGMVLLVYLTGILSLSQLEAQGINLVFFLPIALISLIIHSKSHLIDWREFHLHLYQEPSVQRLFRSWCVLLTQIYCRRVLRY